MKGYKYDVFISYSRKDVVIADKLCEAFDKAGITYFIDRQAVDGGMEFITVISRAIRESQVFLFVASKNAYESKFTQSEVVYAYLKKQKQDIIPYIIDGSELPEELAFTLSTINWRRLDEHPINTVLIKDVKRRLGVKSAPPPPEDSPAKETYEAFLWDEPLGLLPKRRPSGGKIAALIVICVSLVLFLFAVISALAKASYAYMGGMGIAFIVLSLILLLLTSFGLIRPKILGLRSGKDVAKFYLPALFLLIMASLISLIVVVKSDPEPAPQQSNGEVVSKEDSLVVTQHCLPLRDLNVYAITSTSATISWEPYTDCDVNQYEIEYSDGHGTVKRDSTRSNYINVDNLRPNTFYNVKARPDCADGPIDWATVSFQTRGAEPDTHSTASTNSNASLL